MNGLLLDIRYALRGFARRPVVAAGVLLSLAVGIAANTAVFSIFNGTLLRQVPGITRPDRLVEIARSAAGSTTDISFPVYRYLAGQTTILEGVAAFSSTGISIADRDGAAVVRGALAVTSSYFPLLGVSATDGRVFAPGEAEGRPAPAVAVISHEFWQQGFGGTAAISGTYTRINGETVQIIGVLPRGFNGHHTGLLVDVFLPLGISLPGLPLPETLSGPASSVEMLGRLVEGISPSRATAVLGPAADAWARETGESTASSPLVLAVSTWGPLPSVVRGAVAGFLTVLFVLTGLALTMACINVSTIVLARASERQRELAVRRAMGASEGRLARLILTELGVLFVAAGVVGAAAAIWTTGLLGTLTPPVPLPGRLGVDFSPDARVYGFTLALTMAAAAAFSLLPAFRSSRFNLVTALREAGTSETPGRSRMRTILVGVQLAVTSILLAATLMFGRALATLQGLDPGWNGDGVVVAPIDLEQNGTPAEAGQAKLEEILERVAGLPGVEAASLATKLPAGGRSSFGLVSVPGVAEPGGLPGFPASLNRVSSGYFQTMGITMLRGRDIAATDHEGSELVAVINATMSARFWPGVESVGQRFFIDQGERKLSFRVIGVVGDTERRAPGQKPENFYYVPAAQWYNSAVILHVRGIRGQEEATAAAVQRVVREVDPSLPASLPRPVNDALSVYLLPQRVAATVSGAMGVFGLLLAVVGVYGLMAFLVSRRARELAVRVALGASNGDLAKLLLLRAGRGPMVGVVVGTALGSGLAVGASKFVPGARAVDPVVLLGVPSLLLVITALAMAAPVFRLVRRPLMDRLRDE
jgi:putative ABC transport system permease protein